MQQAQQKSHKNSGMNNTTAGAVGAVVGGVVGAAAGIALSDKQRRKMIMQKMDGLKKYVSKTLDEIAQMSEDTTDIIAEKTPLPKKIRSPRKKRLN